MISRLKSRILRDNFQNCVCFLDDAIQAVSKLEESLEVNYVRKHALENQQSQPDLSWEDATSRIFGAQPGTYSSGINLWYMPQHGKIKTICLIYL